MKVLGCILLIVAFSAVNHGGGWTFTLLLMVVSGIVCIFPQVLKYIFEDTTGERK